MRKAGGSQHAQIDRSVTSCRGGGVRVGGVDPASRGSHSAGYTALQNTHTEARTISPGYLEVGRDGGLFAFGDAPFLGSMGAKPLNAAIVAVAVTPSSKGYWEVAADGGVFSFGDARYFGSMGGKVLNSPIVGVAAVPNGAGYWEVASDGGVFSFGDARYFGSMGGKVLNSPIVGIVATPSSKGYWEVASDGGVFSFGDAPYLGSMGSKVLKAPIVGVAAAPDGAGYWEVASDGGVFSFGDARYFGSMGGKVLNSPIVGIASTPDGAGYWEVASDGGIFSFGDAPFSGSMGGKTLSAPITSMTTSTSSASWSQVSAGLAPGTLGYCAVLATGGVECWGYNGNGELGNGTTGGYEDVPTAVSGITNATSVAGGGSNGYCAVLATGGVDCWGANGFGQLGNGTVSSYSDVPVAVSGITNAVSVINGNSNFCAVLATGGVECWGYNGGYSSFPGLGGYLGSGSDSIYSDVPVAVSGISDAKSLAGDFYGYCAVLATGGVECWGYNSDGELGDGSLSDYSNVPMRVAGMTDAVSITNSALSYCAVLATGGIDCWGLNQEGELGAGNVGNSDVPVAVVGINNAQSAAGGTLGYCAVLKIGGDQLQTGGVDCWGSNSFGEFGNALLKPDEVGSSDVPVAVGDGVLGAFTKITNVASIAAGSDNYCALLVSGGLDCWGYNADGELGIGDTTNTNAPVWLPGITNVMSVVSDWSNYCATLATGDVYCWGSNYDGALGDGNTTNSDVPVQVLGINTVMPPPPSKGPGNGPTTGPVIYDALGDSYSSGEGTGPPYLGAGQDGSVAASDTSTDQCHRSQWAYSVVLPTLLSGNWDPTFAACSGAKTITLRSGKGDGRYGEGQQLNRVLNNPDLVTLTIGGNDVHFAPKLKGCIRQAFAVQSIEAALPALKYLWVYQQLLDLLALFLGLPAVQSGASCAKSASFTTGVEDAITNASTHIEEAYRKVRKAAGPNASVVAIGYPKLFPTQLSGQDCIQLSPYLTPSDQVFFNQMADLLDSVEQRAATEAGINFVDVRSLFAGHGVCGSKGEWINGVTLTNSTVTVYTYVPVFGSAPITIAIPDVNASGSFHPNRWGQGGYAAAIAGYLSQRVSEGAPQNADGFPLNPAPQPVPIPAGTRVPRNVPARPLRPATG